MICTKTYPKLCADEPQRAKILKTYHFSYIRALNVYQDLKAKKKQKRLSKQLNLTLLSFHVILISSTS